MNSSNPTLLSSNLWARREEHFTLVVRRALDLLIAMGPRDSDENILNRQLYFCLLRASRELDPEGIYPGPLAECCNQADPDDVTRSRREDKRPDFTWNYLDPHEPDADRSSIQFILECKRLGKPTSPQWILNSNYVEHGVNRFVDPKWAYAKRFASALMVGYWQSMEASDILLEVNCILKTKELPEMVLSSQSWQESSSTQLSHTLPRAFPVSPFVLNHLWLDFRSSLSPGPERVGLNPTTKLP